MGKGNILVIDDAITVSRFIENKLVDRGYKVITAQNAKSGVRKVQKEHPDLIITDFILPDATGGQICSYLRKHAKYNDIPIMLISGDKDNFEKTRLKNFQNVFFLVKPFTGPELGEKVEKILEEIRTAKAPPKKVEKKPPAVDLDALKDSIFQSFESYTDEFIEAKYSFQVKQILFKAITEAFNNLGKNDDND